MLNKSIVVVAALALSSLAVAQIPRPTPLSDGFSAAQGTPGNMLNSEGSVLAVDSTSTCSYQFSSGGSATKQYLQYCITVNGNFVEFQSPSGFEHLRVGNFIEGYSICDFQSGLGYHDYADGGDSDTGAWGAPTLLSLTGTTVKIARTTADGIWTLTQTIQQSPADASAKLTMALKNNTGVSRFVWLARFADIDADGTFSNNLAGTFNKAVGYLPGVYGAHGLELSLAAANPNAHYGWVVTTVNAACNIGSGASQSADGVDGAVFLYNGITIGAGKTATVKLKYQGM